MPRRKKGGEKGGKREGKKEGEKEEGKSDFLPRRNAKLVLILLIVMMMVSARPYETKGDVILGIPTCE